MGHPEKEGGGREEKREERGEERRKKERLNLDLLACMAADGTMAAVDATVNASAATPLKNTIKIFRADESEELLELFPPKQVSSILDLGLFPDAFGLRARGADNKGTGPTYIMGEDVPAGSYVLAVRASPAAAAGGPTFLSWYNYIYSSSLIFLLGEASR